MARSTKLIAPDSVATVTYRKASDAAPLGRISIRVNGRTVDAAIAVRERGIIIADTSAAAKRLHLFRQPGALAVPAGGIPAVADSIGPGSYRLADQLVNANRSRTSSGRSVDVLARFAPTLIRAPSASRCTWREQFRGPCPAPTSFQLCSCATMFACCAQARGHRSTSRRFSRCSRGGVGRSMRGAAS